MVAGWDNILPGWFSRLHPRYKTPVNSLLFVGAITLALALASQVGAGVQEAFQLLDNAANVFYGLAYFAMFAIPLFGAAAIRRAAPMWLRIAAFAGLVTSLLAIFFTVFPIIDVPSPMLFAFKIIAVTAIANALGAAIFVTGRKRAAASIRQAG
jgi:amino acid transporter